MLACGHRIARGRLDRLARQRLSVKLSPITPYALRGMHATGLCEPHIQQNAMVKRDIHDSGLSAVADALKDITDKCTCAGLPACMHACTGGGGKVVGGSNDLR
jgi:hypothetical protein